MVMQYVYLCFMLRLTLVAGQSVYYVLKGKEATLTPALPKHPDDILWKHNGDKVISFDGSEEQVFEPYSNRVTLSWDTAQLAITNLRYEDSGEYELDAIISERLHRSRYMLKVLDEVSKPVIRCEINDKSSDGNNISATLFCSSESNTPEVLTVKWNLEGKSHLPLTLPIALGNEHDDTEYSCTANNPLQKETTVFKAKDCYTEKTSKSMDILVPIIIAVLLLLSFGLFFVIFRHQIERACSKIRNNNDLEKQLNPAGEKKAESVKSEDECTPLIESNIHRQETIPSSQKLPKQEGVDETPLGNVKNIRKNFEESKNTETPTGKRNDRSRRSRSQPSPTSSSGPELNVKHEEPNVSNSKEAFENFSTEPQSSNHEAQVKEDLKPTSEEQDSDQKSDELEDPELEAGDSDEKFEDAPEPKSPNHESKAPEQIGYVKIMKKKFKNPGITETHTGKGSDNGVKATSEPGSPSSSGPAPRPRQMGSEELNLQHKEPNCSKPEGAEDAKSNHSDQDTFEDAQEPQSPSNETQVMDLKPRSEEQESSGQTDSNQKSVEPHKDHEDDQEMDPGSSSSVQSGEGNDTAGRATSQPGSPEHRQEQTGSEELNLQHEVPNVSKSKEAIFENFSTEPQSSNREAQVKEDLKPTSEKQDSDQKSDDLEDPGSSGSDSSGQDESKAPEQISEGNDTAGRATSQPGSPEHRQEQTSSGERNVQHKEPNGSKPEGAEDAKSNHSDQDTFEEAQETPSPNSEAQVNKDLKPRSEEQDLDQKSDKLEDPGSSCSDPSVLEPWTHLDLRESKGHKESNSAGKEPQNQESLETPGSGEQVDESTHPPASSSSQHADNKETKDTDGEHTEDANPLHVKETKDKTNKESDSPGSGQRNGADTSKVEKQDEVVDDEKSNT